jgi:hypothetical protein
MNVEEKKTKKFGFIHEHFTESAFTELALFDRNSKNLINVIRLEMMMQEKLERREFETGLGDEFLSEAQDFLYLDTLAKIMMLIEGLLALAGAIADPVKSYAGIAETMTEYPLILPFIARLRENQVDLWKLAGLPELEKLPINLQEREELKRALDETVRIFEQFLATIIDFYECNKIPYNKFKHGLSVIPGMQLRNPQGEIFARVLAALDTKSKAPPYTCIEMKERLVPPDVGWYNAVCFVAPPNRNKHQLIINSLLSAIPFLTSNHLFYAVNCGEDYFPLKPNPDGTYVPMLLLPKESRYLEEDHKKLLEPIIKKVTDNMNIPKMTVNFNLNFTDDAIAKMLKCFAERGSALIWSSESQPGTARVDLTY